MSTLRLNSEREHDKTPAEQASKITNSSDYTTEVYREAYNEFSEEIISEEEEEIIEEVTESDYSEDDDEAYDENKDGDVEEGYDDEEDYGDYYGDDLTYSDEEDSNQSNSEADRHVLLVNAIGAGNDADGGDSNE